MDGANQDHTDGRDDQTVGALIASCGSACSVATAAQLRTWKFMLAVALPRGSACLRLGLLWLVGPAVVGPYLRLGLTYNRTVMSPSTVTRQESRPMPMSLSMSSSAWLGGGAPSRISTRQSPQCPRPPQLATSVTVLCGE